jgi:hypothetical protein
MKPTKALLRKRRRCMECILEKKERGEFEPKSGKSAQSSSQDENRSAAGTEDQEESESELARCPKERT